MKLVQINMSCGSGSTGKICVAVSRLLTEKGVENYVLYSLGQSDYPLGRRYMDKHEVKLQALSSRIFGNYGFSFSPIIFMLCGYCCGAFVGWFLSKNLPSFVIFAALAGIFKEIFTFVYFGLFSTEFSLWKIFTSVVIPEYFAYLICVLPAYGAIFGVYRLIKGKDKKKSRDMRP